MPGHRPTAGTDPLIVERRLWFLETDGLPSATALRSASGGKRTLLPLGLRLTILNMEARISLAGIGQKVATEIDTFVVPAPRSDQLGELLPAEWFSQQLDDMRAALIEPYLVEIDGDGRFPGGLPKPVPRQVVVVAEDADVLLAYDPDPDGDFALIFKSASGFGVSPIRGEAVYCFMSR